MILQRGRQGAVSHEVGRRGQDERAKVSAKGLLRSLRGTGCFLSKRTLTFGATGLHIWVLKKFSLPGGSDGKEYACNAGDPGPIPGLGRSPGGGHGNPL